MHSSIPVQPRTLRRRGAAACCRPRAGSTATEHIEQISRARIAAYPVGARFPSMFVLCSEFGVHPVTVAKALRCHGPTGYRRGVGTSVLARETDRAQAED